MTDSALPRPFFLLSNPRRFDSAEHRFLRFSLVHIACLEII